jgi:Mn2+/Fe2+ NRAMP family transporter
LHHHPEYVREHLSRIKQDTVIGMSFSNLIALCIVISTAVTLNMQGVTGIETSAQAALALKPIAGEFAFLIFSLGIIGTGLLAVPVLAGSAAYAVSELFDWTEGLDRQWKESKAFYGVIAAATLGGAMLNFTSLDPMKALYWSAVVNGVLAAPLMGVMMIMGKNEDLMGRFTLSRPMYLMGWLATFVMAGASLVFGWLFLID